MPTLRRRRRPSTIACTAVVGRRRSGAVAAAMGLLLLLLALSCGPSDFVVSADAFEDLWEKYMRADRAADTAKIASLETQLQAAQEEKKTMEKAAKHASRLIDAFLFPVKAATTNEATREQEDGSEEGKTEIATTAIKDPFAILHSTDGWEKGKETNQDEWNHIDEHPTILRNCVIHSALDYCNRYMVHDLQEEIDNDRGNEEGADRVASLVETRKRRTEQNEPYCAIFEKCFDADFADDECRPEINPLKNEGAQLYLSSCFNPMVQDEYGVVFGLINEGETMVKKYGGA